MRKIILRGTASGFLLAGTVTVGLVANTAWAQSQNDSSVGFEWKDGTEVYAKVCGHCHETKVGPVIRGRHLPAAYVRTIVRDGLRAMPSFRSSEIDDTSLEKVAEYISKN
ncbi:cytochrome c [Nitrosospira sp. NpAV]|uniref:c-type cytochrome n=1 Tax=Nitrosospira sp. NpAV TaxID=58133 RepID=UPI00059F9EBB|nr:cytochrome c [Nitrosospira sp. NpAV]KIO49515.1 cytochrome C [Nitrosospira sp. NpAV]